MESAVPRRAGPGRTVLMLCFALLLPVGASAQSPAPDSVRSAADGVYSAAQAKRGEAKFRSSCGNCHGTAQFSGPDFRKMWTGRTVYDLFDQLRNTMPLDNPGGFSAEEYAAVIAYVLELNRYPAGPSPLPHTDPELRRVRF